MSGIARRRALGLLAVLSACLFVIASTGCGGDDEPDEEVVTETVVEGDETGGTATDSEAPGAETTPTFSAEQAEADATNAMREFNRAVNLGKLDEACSTYFSEALLAVVAAESDCPRALRIMRGEGKHQLEIGSASYRESDGTTTVAARVGGAADLRRFPLVYEDGIWKIDAVLDGTSDPIFPELGPATAGADS